MGRTKGEALITDRRFQQQLHMGAFHHMTHFPSISCPHCDGAGHCGGHVCHFCAGTGYQHVCLLCGTELRPGVDLCPSCTAHVARALLTSGAREAARLVLRDAAGGSRTGEA